MELGDEVVLRPRFKMELECSGESALQAFDMAKAAGKEEMLAQYTFMKRTLEL